MATPAVPNLLAAASVMARIAVVDRDVESTRSLRESLARQGYEVRGFGSAEEALAALETTDFAALLTDLEIKTPNGVALWSLALEHDPHLAVILVSGEDAAASAAEAMKQGAVGYVCKPATPQSLAPVLTRALDTRRLQLENLDLHEMLAAYELSQAVAQTLNPNAILNKITDAAATQWHADEVSIMVPDGDGALEVVAVRGGARDQLLGTRERARQSIAAWVARQREALVLHGEIRDPRFAPSYPRADIRVSASIPMLTGNKLVGVLNLNCTGRRRAFSPSQVKALKLFASTASAALETARLYEHVRSAETRYQRLLDNVDEIVYLLEIDPNDPLRGVPRFVSQRVTSIIGWTPEDLRADPDLWPTLIHADDIKTFAQQTLRVYENGGATTREFRIRHKHGGEYRWMEDRTLAQRDATGRIVSLFGVARDVTERKQIEQALREAEARLRLALEAGRIGTWDWDMATNKIVWSRGHEELWGMEPGTFRGTYAEFDARLHPNDRAGLESAIKEAIAERNKYRHEFRVVWPDGSVHWIVGKGEALYDAAGKPVCMIGTVSDITERKEAEHALHDHQRTLDTLMSNLPGMVYRCRNDPQWTVEFASQGSIELTGYTPEDFIGNHTLAYADIIHPDDRDPIWEAVQRGVDERRPFELRYRIRTREGQEKSVWEQGRGIFSESGELLALEGYITDVTDIEHAQADLAEREARYKALVEGIPDLLVRVRSDGTYIDFKPALGFPTYVPPDQFIGRKVTDIMPAPVAAEHMKTNARALATGKQQVTRYQLERGGESHDYEARVVPAGPDEVLAIVRDITVERRGAEQIAKLASAVEQTADSVIITDANGIIEYVNPAFEHMTGYQRSEALGKQPNLLRSGQQPKAFYDQLWATIRRGKEFRAVFINRRKDGAMYYEEKSITPLKGSEGRITHFVSTGKDITERRQHEDTIARLGRILDESSNEIYMFDAQTLQFVQVNEGARQNLGYTLEELQTLTPLDIKPEFDRDSFEQLLAPLRSGAQPVVSFVTSHQRKDGSFYPVEVRLQLSRAEQPPLFVAIIQDITARRQAEERLSYLAYYDTLTGLPNRALLHESLRQSMVEADRRERLVAVLMLDLDRFKIINDTLGHSIGDGLLKAVGQRLAAAVRPGDTVARLGGDEFALVLANIAGSDDVAHVVQKILSHFTEAVHVAGHELYVTPSLGITLYPLDGSNIDDLLRNADTAMYQAKARGRNNFQFFTNELNQRAERRLALENAMHQVLARGEMFLEYQPQIDLASGRITGCEALLRWRHPELGLVSPLEFISIAEDTGLILPIGEWVLRQACQEVAAWHRAGYRDLRVAVNVSARQLHLQDFQDLARRVLIETGLPAAALDLEITEGTLLHDVEETLDLLNALAAHGVCLSIDDFGTGYSSLAYLRRLPLETLKVDRAFVGDVTADAGSAAIVRAIIAMGRSLNMTVIAEGVETAAQVKFLREHGCHGAQGFYFSRPISPEEFKTLLSRQNPKHRGPVRGAAPKSKKQPQNARKRRRASRR